MKKKDKLRSIIREEVKKELVYEGAKGAIIGYLVGVLADFFFKKRDKSISSTKTKEELEKELKTKLDRKYETDPKFREIVDTLMAGKKIDV
jgi:hypothetical protein